MRRTPGETVRSELFVADVEGNRVNLGVRDNGCANGCLDKGEENEEVLHSAIANVKLNQ